MPEVDVPKEKEEFLWKLIIGSIGTGEREFLDEDPKKPGRRRYRVNGEELSVDLDTGFTIYHADLSDGHLKSLAVAGVVFEENKDVSAPKKPDWREGAQRSNRRRPPSAGEEQRPSTS